MEMVRKHHSCREINIYVEHLVEKPLLDETANDDAVKQPESR